VSGFFLRIFQMIKELKVDEVRTEGMQTRASMSEDVIAEYTASMVSGAVFPEIECFFDGDKYWLADGFHRLEAAIRKGDKKIKAEIFKGSQLDALRYALKSNINHGLRRTNADKKRAVMVAYENRIALGLGEVPSSRTIADVVGVHHTFSANQLATVATWRDAGERKGADGKTYSLPPPRPKKVEKQEKNDVLEPETPVSTQIPPPPPPKPPAPPAPPPRQIVTHTKDSIGNIVPPNLLETWGRRDAVKEASVSVRAVRLAIKKAEDTQDPVWAGINFSNTIMHIDNVLAQVEGAIPYCVCLICQGIGCRACSGVGIMTEFQYKNLPREIKK
jgi:hypothetical protein